MKLNDKNDIIEVLSRSGLSDAELENLFNSDELSEIIEIAITAREENWFVTAPAPLPETDGASTFAGSVDYGGNGDGQELENVF